MDTQTQCGGLSKEEARDLKYCKKMCLTGLVSKMIYLTLLSALVACGVWYTVLAPVKASIPVGGVTILLICCGWRLAMMRYRLLDTYFKLYYAKRDFLEMKKINVKVTDRSYQVLINEQDKSVPFDRKRDPSNDIRALPSRRDRAIVRVLKMFF